MWSYMSNTQAHTGVSVVARQAWLAIARLCVWAREGNQKKKKKKDVSHSGKCLCTLSQEVCHDTETSTRTMEGRGQRSTFP